MKRKFADSKTTGMEFHNLPIENAQEREKDKIN